LTKKHKEELLDLKNDNDKIISDLNKKYEIEIKKLISENEDAIHSLKEKHNEEQMNLNIMNQNVIKELKDSYEKEIKNINNNNEKLIQSMKDQYQKEINNLNENNNSIITELNNKHQKELLNLKNENEKSKEYSHAQNNTLSNLRKKITKNIRPEYSKLLIRKKININVFKQKKKQDHHIKLINENIDNRKSTFKPIIEANTQDTSTNSLTLSSKLFDGGETRIIELENRYKQEIDDLTNKYNQKIKNLKTQNISIINQEQESLKKDINNLNNKIFIDKTELKELKDKYETLLKEKEELKNNYIKERNNNKTIKKENEKQKKKLSNLEEKYYQMLHKINNDGNY